MSTTATLLATVAVAALSGCVTVQRPPAPVASAASVLPPAPRPDGTAGRQAAQAPAREALEFVGSSASPKPTGPSPSPESAEPTRVPAVPSPAEKRQNPSAPHSPGRRVPSHPAPRRADPPLPPRTQGPALRPADLCALGRQYGGWRPDSPEARICSQTYGR
ncbi:hypothetical protein [Streptomyces triticisoli]|jgi:hypothetical protein|uniref:hypothetical protein n=1 Tax=Streptomyces triticisoli TaxID=2182797 RepID=UPI001E4B6632|nr:hypothetical protein [Streptomyces triticisoli]